MNQTYSNFYCTSSKTLASSMAHQFAGKLVWVFKMSLPLQICTWLAAISPAHPFQSLIFSGSEQRATGKPRTPKARLAYFDLSEKCLKFDYLYPSHEFKHFMPVLIIPVSHFILQVRKELFTSVSISVLAPMSLLLGKYFSSVSTVCQ